MVINATSAPPARPARAPAPRPAPAPGGREDTRARILAEAVDLFAEQGFSATTTRELAERMGFTKAALYYHFHTKDDLLLALVEPITAQIGVLAAGPPRVGDAARRTLLAGYADLVVTHRRVIRMLSHDPAVARNEAVVTRAKAAYGPLVAALRPPDPDPTAADTRVRAALGAIHAGLLTGPPDADPAVVRAATLAAAGAALGLREESDA